MYEIIALFTILNPCLSTTTTRQLCRVVFALLAMSGRVTMLNISRWTGQGGSYRTVQRFFNTVIPWATICWMFFRTHLLDCESDYILAGDEVVVPQSGKSTYGLSRFFSALYSKAIPGLSFLAVSLVSVNRRRSYPMVMDKSCVARHRQIKEFVLPNIVITPRQQRQNPNTGVQKGAGTGTKTMSCSVMC